MLCFQLTTYSILKTVRAGVIFVHFSETKIKQKFPHAKVPTYTADLNLEVYPIL